MHRRHPADGRLTGTGAFQRLIGRHMVIVQTAERSVSAMWNRKTKSARLAAGLFASIMSVNANGQPPPNRITAATNSLWNDDDGFGFWISRKPKTCGPKFHIGYPFLVVGPAGSHVGYSVGTLDAKTVHLCAYMEEGSVTRCAEGSVNYKFDRASNTFSGAYDVLLEDRRRLTGVFMSIHCARSGS
jgi:hypothetical protein